MVLKLILASMVGVAIRTRYSEITSAKGIVTAALDELEMAPAPIEPSWIIAGNPEARLSLHSRSADQQATTAIWDCTAGTFRWYFGWDETVLILDGEVRVTGEDGAERVLKEGDIAYFPAGSSAVWHIDDYVRKIAFGRREFPGSVNMALKLREKFRR
ncbi:cupin domain-containing protein (plasmid) [Shinella yambaruensis]|uniref:cupin domain-containing protein n=1 Tax=Shinella yambaruensis TaxID=415996 RepID=UPI003D78D420